ncbi:hypothetical protein B0T22DRAFT_531038 [Podospora appendiculata]|uniref:Mid2 domain-containing protein n=1 Tax=Podospora appendiculata TaxID=314037 RepID=A0AAE1C8R1_9PEZI|nr:hypothetical protein B0T22DRAFT_531038 [Podospora appendiculata]
MHFSLETALCSLSPPLVAVRTRNLPGTSDRDIIHGIYRRLDQAIRLAGRDIDTVVGSFPASSILASVTSQVGTDIDNIIGAAYEIVKTYLFDSDSSFQHHVMDIDFNIDMLLFPAVELMFQFDAMELYMLLDITLTNSTYTLQLYKSESPIGLNIGEGLLNIGVFTTVDLILSTEAEIIIQSGFHIKLNDGVALKIALFGQNVSDIILDSFQFGAGVEVGVFAHLAEFATNITSLNSPDASGCSVRVAEEYTLAIGAAAGATVFYNEHTWGPVVATTTPIFYTTMAEGCAARTTRAKAATTVTPEINGRQNGALTTTIISTTAVFTGVACAQVGLVNCPMSLQRTTVTTSTITLVTSVPSGVYATFPATTATTPVVTIPFGTNAKSLATLSGSPTSFIPPPATHGVFGGNATAIFDGSTGGVSNKMIIGVSVGGGLLVLIALIVGLKRAAYAKGSPSTSITVNHNHVAQSAPGPWMPPMKQGEATVQPYHNTHGN